MKTRGPLTLLLVLLLSFPTSSPQAVQDSWSLRFSDDFNGNQIDSSSWSVYGKNGPKGPHCYHDRNITVGGGIATLRVIPGDECDGYSASGMCACRVTTQVYGKYEVRMKATEGNSKITLLLWPVGQWPPEIDFAEFPATGDGMRRQRFNQTLHYSPQNRMIHTHTDADMTGWHTVGLEWSPGLVVYTLDGQATATISQHVPTVPMWLGIQTGGSAAATPAYTYVDWVRVHTYDG